MSFDEVANRIYHALGRQFRRRRLERFEQTFSSSVYRRVIDVGGTKAFWSATTRDVLLVDLAFDDAQGTANVRTEIGDGRSLRHPDAMFDLAFSNSAIEHVGTRGDQCCFAAELRRVGRAVYCQTPNRWFPFEVHYWCMFVHWFPRLLRNYFVVRYLTGWGWLVRPDRQGVAAYADSVNLLSHCELQALFPDCRIERERFLCLTKSLMAVRF